MPSSKKTLHFLTSTIATSAGVAVLGYGMSTQWTVSEMTCSAKGEDNFNGTANVNISLFSCTLTRKSCPIFDGDGDCEVLKLLTEIGGPPFILHATVITLLALSLLSSTGSLLISLYNSVSNPYETYMGPLGLYACSSTSCILALFVLILFVINALVVGEPQELVQGSVNVDLIDISTELQVGFYLLIPYMACSVIAILCVFLYEHTAYTQRKEQQRPTEDAPKEIMMY